MKCQFGRTLGAGAVVIYNSVDGTFGMDLSDYAYTVPVVSILKADADAIRALSTSETSSSGIGYNTGSLTILENLAVKEHDSAYHTMSSFSSWGVPGDLSIKPEITAPGTSPTTFSPGNECQRAQVVTFLWRARGSPRPALRCIPSPMCRRAASTMMPCCGPLRTASPSA